MRPMQAGIVAALVLLIVVDNAGAQQSRVIGLAAGSYVSGPVYGSAVVSQPVIAGGVVSVVGAPIVAGTIIGEPVVTSGIVGQPVVSGEVLTALPTTYAAPVVTTFPAQGLVMPYNYGVSAPHPARIYVEYGAIDQFPFRGRAYAIPGDRWSWYYMGGGDSRYLAKYYYPLLR